TYPSYALNLAQLGALCISNLCATKPVPTIKSVNDPILSSLYNKGEKFSFPEYGALAKKYNERSQVIKAFAIKNSCK
ncbi:hypothetical protein RR27_18550, partial [Acinetobacter baumannii]